VPLNLGAKARAPELGNWLEEVTQGLGFDTLAPEGWFTKGHGYGNYIWERGRCSCLAIEEGAAETPGVHAYGCSSPIDDGSLAQALGSRHRRRFRDKSCDGIWTLSAQFEPILIYVCLPFKSHHPRLEERWKLLGEFQEASQGRHLSKVSARERGGILRQLLESARELSPLPRGVVPYILPTGRSNPLSSHASVR
jgi:hypothetical protein